MAYWLNRLGFQVTVVEVSAGLRPGGQALDVRGPALRVAEGMGILDEIRERSTRLRGMSVVDRTGEEIFQTTERTLTGGRFDAPDVEILRDDLVGVLHAAAGEHVRYVFGDRITALRQDELGVEVTFESAAPARFDFVVGADGMHSGVRRLAFGPEQQFLRYLGGYVAVMTIPNFTGLDRWQTFHIDENVGAGIIGLGRDEEARAYLGFQSDEPIEYDFRDASSQKQLLTDRVKGMGWVVPQIVELMRDASSFHFDSRSQVVMERWTHGRVTLVGDAGYAVSLTTGQGTSIAMTCAYVLAGELASAANDLAAGAIRYEQEVRDYVLRSQAAARKLNDEETEEGPGGFTDFGELVEDLALKDYLAVTG
ncbi:2-polyprenyl-6-methoxyphenol hydroxylase-like FAD-dependent oxidoreductase [Micromonospora ureilytica]|uniref:2-polyprenyl-6-methoxyphenol hydroxylase-like FAD-dependent oxidoreductase n=1 Tax=Micromonospora ureilytica TaxID=709868 RepID=A0ABS0JC54_9ACTN|nr:2-polyprenyl-6-methoxyphenol hydroxylase-like FAD-dependent oxidoreductase [Micromonospora ureilytica]